MTMWDDLACSRCGAAATVLLGGGNSDGEEVELAACEECRPVVFGEVMRTALGSEEPTG